MNSIRRAKHKQRIVVFIALIIWTVLLGRVIDVVRPAYGVTDFNSDTAIPVLMANDQRQITVFDTYYYGADRSGAWLLLVARIINHLTGFHWTNDSLHIVRAVWLFLGILILALLNRRAAGPVILIGLLATCGLWILRLRLFDVAQVYALQITLLIIVWFALRKWFDDSNSRQYVRVISIFAVLVFSLLAVWTSPVSGPLICVLVIVEAFRSMTRRDRTARPSIVKRGLVALSLAITAGAAEFLWRVIYHRYALTHFNESFKTEAGLDVGYLAINLRTQLQIMTNFEWSLLIVLAAVVVIGISIASIYFWLGRRTDSLKRIARLMEYDTSFTILATLSMAATNLAIVIAVKHVRISDYDNRYLTITFVFGSISGLLVVWHILRYLVEKTAARNYPEAVFGVVALVVLINVFPARHAATAYDLRKQAALALERKSPKAILMGGYWESYVFAGLQKQDAPMPLPLEGFMVRMPWIREALKNASEVVIEYKHTNAGTVPPGRIIQYGVRLQQVDAHWYENSKYGFARYVRAPVILTCELQLQGVPSPIGVYDGD